MSTATPIPHYSTDIIPGMDMKATVSSILAVKNQQVTDAQTAEKTIQTKISDWGDISSSISTLSDALNALNSDDTWNKMNVTSNNGNAVQATATSAATPNTYTIEVTHLAQAQTVASNTASALGVTSSTADLIAAGVLHAGDTFTIEGQKITVGAAQFGVTTSGKETLASLQTKINTASASMTDKVTASILDNRLVIARASTGSTQMVMSDGTSSGTPALQALGFLASDETFNSTNVTQVAQDALFAVNGLSVTRASNTNLTDVMQGVTLNLLAPTGATPATVSIAHDTTTATTAIQNFITSYNTATTKLTDYTKVTLNGGSAPTASDLQGDTLIPDMLTQLRSLATSTKGAFLANSYTYNGKTGNMVSLQAVGVGTSSEANQLSVTDQTRLTLTLANNFSQVQKLFQGVPINGTNVHGVASDLAKYTSQLSAPVTGGIAKHVFTIQTSDKDALAHIKAMTDSISQQEQDLWAQLSNTQGAIQQMKTSMSWLSGSSGSSSGG